MAARLPLRTLARQARTRCTRRHFSSHAAMLEAHNFMMPAMSPTMTEGNISAWRVKEGDSFSTGDVLLEIETDKATMDVEAQDEGVMAKIIEGDGSKSVAVGSRIAVLADVGDDLSSLKIPEDTAVPVKSAADNVAQSKEEQDSDTTPIKGTPENKRPARDRPNTSPVGPGQNPKYPLYPSVLLLIHQNHISDADVPKIPATGPRGRLLKGDVLAYIGQIEADYSKRQSERIEHLAHLDLSNIKVVAAAAAQTPSQQIADSTRATAQLPRETTISLPISLTEVLKVQKRIQDTLGTTLPLSDFLARAVDYANDNLPRLKTSKATQDELFNAVLGLDRQATTSRGAYLPQIDARTAPSPTTKSSSRPTTQPDIMDILTGKVQPVRSASNIAGRAAAAAAATLQQSTASAAATRGALNVFTLTVPVAEETRAKIFLERMKTILQVEPGKLVL